MPGAPLYAQIKGGHSIWTGQILGVVWWSGRPVGEEVLLIATQYHVCLSGNGIEC